MSKFSLLFSKLNNIWFENINLKARYTTLVILNLLLAVIITSIGSSGYALLTGNSSSVAAYAFWFFVWLIFFGIIIWIFFLILNHRHELMIKNYKLEEITKEYLENEKRIAELIEQLKNETKLDDLTGLNNMKYLEEEGPRIIHQAIRDNKIISICFVDGRGFKDINNTYGHDVGDDIIRIMAKTLKENVRPYDLLIRRQQGDEFIVLATIPEGKELEICSRIAGPLKKMSHWIKYKGEMLELPFVADVGKNF